VKKDRTFTFETKTPPTSWLLKKAAGIEKGAESPGKENTGTVSLKHIYEVAKIKQLDEPHLSLEQVSRSVIGSTRSCGITVVV
jgi:large subunit ribosomal protein L11